MYTMNPVVDLHWNSHVGFYLMAFIVGCAIWLVIALRQAGEIDIGTSIGWSLCLFVILALVHAESYQPEVKYTNRRTTGKFVGYQAEGFSERSGKSTVERHYVYVVYEIEGRQVLFNAQTNTSYPPEAVFYYNPTK